MHISRLLSGALISLALCAVATAATAPGPTITTPATTKWMPGTGMMKGVTLAALVGDPTKSGMYIVRMKIPAGTTFPAHVHGGTENVTVISGSIWVGVGKTVDKSKMTELGPGAFVSIPANLAHFAAAKQEAVIQLEGMGPMTMTEAK